MAKKKKKVPPGRQTRPGEAVQKKKSLPGKAFPAKKKPTQYRPGEGPQPGGKSKPGSRPPATANTPAPTATTPSETAETTTPVATGDERRRVLMQYVRAIGLPESVTDFLITKANSGELPEDADQFDYTKVLVEEPSFKARFPSIVEQFNRVSAGDTTVQIMSPMEVIEYEKRVRAVADDYGLSSWVTSPEQISALILNDVDVDEAVERINLAGYAAMQAPKTFRDAFIGKFGLTEGNLAGYFLDPTKEEGVIRKMVSQGNIMSAALTHGFGNDWRIAERLFDRGFLPADANGMVGAGDAMSGFAKAALTSAYTTGYGDTGLTEDERIDAAFGDAASQQKLLNVQAQRLGRFNTSGGSLETNKGVSGLGSASST